MIREILHWEGGLERHLERDIGILSAVLQVSKVAMAMVIRNEYWELWGFMPVFFVGCMSLMFFFGGLADWLAFGSVALQ